MSCHFHMLRRKRAAEAAQRARNAAESDFAESPKPNTADGEKTRESASERRRKAIQKKGDAQ